MHVKVTKLTDVDLLRKCASYTTGRDCSMSLATAYRHNHSLIRSQIFFVELQDIPLFVASQFVRSHVGVQFFQLSKRPDRGGADFKSICKNIHDNLLEAYAQGDDVMFTINSPRILELPSDFDRYAPTDLAFIINAEAIINMSHKRLCNKASKETHDVWGKVCEAIRDVDPALYEHLVPQCIYRGGICGEPRCCGFNKTERFRNQMDEYSKLYQ